MSVARITEIKASSPISFQDALEQGIARACQTLDNVRSSWIANQEVQVDIEGKICAYMVHLKVTFVLED